MEPFDLEKYLRISKRLDLDDLDWSQIREHPLGEDEIRVIRYFLDIETYTIIYLKELLSTPAAYDPEITSFLGCWNYEEFFHGHSLERFLREYGVDVTKRPADTKQTENVWNKIFLVGQRAFSSLMDWRFICLHMTWGALNELTTLHGYQALARHTRHPMLREIYSRIIKDERRHFSFYYNQARRRLEDPLSRKMTRFLMERLWTIVGTGVKPMADVDHLVRTLFADSAGQAAAEEMDKVMGALPGFEGLDMVRRKLASHLDRVDLRVGPALPA